MITNVAIEKLHPHPDNPRKDLGDLSELAESIKTRGVLQNLTVVPIDPTGTGTDYTVIIGHRRLAASQMAGLTELPCAITDMDFKTQIATMLLENIQRSDLTLVEEATGLQMMLDLGESVKNISAKTGLSETTVRRRVKLVKEFDREALLRVQGRPINIDDYEKLYKIKDEAARADVFEKIGTRDFDWAYNGAISRQESNARKTVILETLSTFATQVSYGDYQKANILKSDTYWRHEKEDVTAVKKLAAEAAESGEEWCYTSQGEFSGTTVFTKDGDKAAWVKKQSEDQDKRKATIAAVKALFAQAYATRLSFARDFRTKSKQADAVDKMVIDALFLGGGGYMSEETFRAFYDIEKRFRQSYEKPEKGETYAEAAARILDTRSGELNSNTLFIGAYCCLERVDANCVNYNGKFEPNEKLSLLYKHLAALGYAMSDDEIALMEGTHVAYAVNRDAADDNAAKENEDEE